MTTLTIWRALVLSMVLLWVGFVALAVVAVVLDDSLAALFAGLVVGVVGSRDWRDRAKWRRRLVAAYHGRWPSKVEVTYTGDASQAVATLERARKAASQL